MVGTELLLGQVVDTNASYLAERLAELGIDLYFKSTVGDNWLRISSVLAQALVRSDVVITSGGLGPTEDDITKEVAAAAMGEDLAESREAMDQLESVFRRMGRTMTERGRKQALLPESAQMIPNRTGTAPGMILCKGGKTVICLPGVPSEMKAMMEETVIPYLARRTAVEGGSVIKSKVLRFYGLGESLLEERARDIISAQTNPTIAPYVGQAEVSLRITAKAPFEGEADSLIAPVEGRLRERFGDHIFGVDSDRLESVVASLLIEAGLSLSVAESCTGGLLAHRLTNVPGSSGYLELALVCYSNSSKMNLLGVPESELELHGAVSDAVARGMALGVKRLGGTSLGMSITGIAGPGGATSQKPVGLVCMALAHPRGVTSQEQRFIGDREGIKYRASQAALDMLRRYLI